MRIKVWGMFYVLVSVVSLVLNRELTEIMLYPGCYFISELFFSVVCDKAVIFNMASYSSPSLSPTPCPVLTVFLKI